MLQQLARPFGCPELTSLANTYALLSGGNSGIGVETARVLAQAGAKVILTSRKLSAGEEVVASLQAAAGVKVRYTLQDVVL